MVNLQHLGLNVDGKLLNSRDRRSQKRLVWKNPQKSAVELTVILNAGHRGISIRTMRRELKAMNLNSRRAQENHLFRRLTTNNIPNLLSSIKIGMLCSGEMSFDLMGQDLAYYRTMGSSGLEGNLTEH
ncbi:hypothetical protein AVEN_43061-1 [Araneus ventricosus]|uniref:Transposase Tc1-like domain-containing protein n=1 Tax=Araneus ventricosus TaxID=182803 RepID=A0A4Y2HN64_ARAVE|nr:hypothetical protein AVEN_43061-1 [Araneus ventricosus]